MVPNPARRGQLNRGAQKTRLIFHQKRAYVAATFVLGSIELVTPVFARTSVCRLYLGEMGWDVYSSGILLLYL